jgi:hypothetical protein
MDMPRFDRDRNSWKRCKVSPEKLAGSWADETANLKLKTENRNCFLEPTLNEGGVVCVAPFWVIQSFLQRG